MNSLEIFVIVFVMLFASAMFGMYLQTRLPDSHLSPSSKDSIKLATGMIATMAALLLGLLVSSAKSSFDQVSSELVETAANVVVLDRTLAIYGPETREIRDLLKKQYTQRIAILTSGNDAQLAQLSKSSRINQLETFQIRVPQLVPNNDAQRQLQSQAVQIINELIHARWLLLLQSEGTVSMPLMMVLVLWLVIIFTSFGLFSAKNRTVVLIFLTSTLSVSFAIFLILELSAPFTGFITIPAIAMHDAISHLGM